MTDDVISCARFRAFVRPKRVQNSLRLARALDLVPKVSDPPLATVELLLANRSRCELKNDAQTNFKHE